MCLFGHVLIKKIGVMVELVVHTYFQELADRGLLLQSNHISVEVLLASAQSSPNSQ